MDMGIEFLGENLIYLALTLEGGEAFKERGNNVEFEVSFGAFGTLGVGGVKVGFIDDCENGRAEGHGELLGDTLVNRTMAGHRGHGGHGRHGRHG